MRLRTVRETGYTLVEIMLVVAIIGLLLGIALPSWHRARENAQLNSIANNLRLLESAKQQWALENKKVSGDSVATDDLTAYLKNNTMPAKIVNEDYVVSTVSDLVTAVYSGSLAGKTGPYTVTSF